MAGRGIWCCHSYKGALVSGESCYDQSTFQPFDAEFPAVYRKIIMDGLLFAELVFVPKERGRSLSLELFPKAQTHIRF